MANPLPEFPMEVIEHVQIFMNFKEAARSACLCKSLYNSWMRIRRIDFDERLFASRVLFWLGALRTMKRYLDLSLSIDTVTFRMFGGSYQSGSCSRIIECAASLGAAEINVIVFSGEATIHLRGAMFIPNRLVKLSLTGGTLCVGDDLLFICSSIKSLVLRPCRYIGLKGVLLNEYIAKCPSLETLEVTGQMLLSQYHMPDRIFHSIDTLIINGLTFQDHASFSNIIRMFPSLKSLEISNIKNFRRLELCSDTLESLIITDRYRSVRALIKIPRLRMFRFEGSAFSRFMFESPNIGWTSHITLVCFIANDSWLSNVHEFLCQMVPSAIYLGVKSEFGTNTPKILRADCEQKILVECLSVLSAHPDTNLINGLRQVCAPRVVRALSQEH